MAKFKVGDKIKVKGGHIMSGASGTVVKVGQYPISGEVKVDAKMSDGTVVDWGEDDIEPAANACRNAHVRNFDKGDRVRSRVTGKTGVIMDFKDSFGPGRDNVQYWTRDYYVKWDGEPGSKLVSQADIVANACKNAKFKVGDKVTDGSGVYLITGIDNDFGSYEWKLISGRADPSHSEGGDFGWADAKMKIANAKACNSRNPIVAKALNACATNAAYPKASDKTIGNVTAFFLPRYDEMGLEFGSVLKGNYMSIEGSRAEVRSKVRGKVKGQDLSDALKLCDWADSEMEKYRKSEQSHGRKVAQNGRDILMELGTIEGDIEDGDMAEARSWLREIKNEAMRKGYYKEWNQLAMRAGM